MVFPLHLKNRVLLPRFGRGCFTADLPIIRTTVATNFLTIRSTIALKHDVYVNVYANIITVKALGNYVSNLAHTYFLTVFTKTVHTWTKVIKKKPDTRHMAARTFFPRSDAGLETARVR